MYKGRVWHCVESRQHDMTLSLNTTVFLMGGKHRAVIICNWCICKERTGNSTTKDRKTWSDYFKTAVLYLHDLFGGNGTAVILQLSSQNFNAICRIRNPSKKERNLSVLEVLIQSAAINLDMPASFHVVYMCSCQ